MQCPKQSVVPAPQDERIELHNGPAPKIVDAILAFGTGNCIDDLGKGSFEILRALHTFGGILGQVLQHGPQIQKSTPVNVTEVIQQDMLLEAIQQRIVPVQKQVPQLLPMGVLFDNSFHDVAQEP